MRKTLAFLSLGVSLLVVGGAHAQSTSSLASAPTPISTAKPSSTNYLPSDTVARVAKKPQGMSYGVTLAALVNVASNRDVVGQVNGNTVLFGASAIGNLSYLRGAHEWLNTGSIAETWSRTPALGEFVKSNDLLDVQSLYNYFLRDWTGPFLRLAVQTTVLPTERVTAGAQTYVRDTDGATISASRFRLSDSFQPFTLNESAGWFFQPIHSDVFSAYGRVGFGGRHTFAEGARAITDEDDMRGVVFTVLRDVHQAGAELFAGFDGKAVEGRLLYNLGVSALFPFANNDVQNRSIAELTKISLQAAAGMKVTDWLAVNYQLKLIRDVQLIDAIQVQNALLLSLQYTKSSPVPDAPKSETEIAKERVAALQAELAAMHVKLTQAEERLHAQQPEPPAQLEPPPAAPAPTPTPVPAPMPAPPPAP